MAVMDVYWADQSSSMYSTDQPLFYYGVMVLNVPRHGLAEWEIQVCSFPEPVEVAIGRRWERVS